MTIETIDLLRAFEETGVSIHFIGTGKLGPVLEGFNGQELSMEVFCDTITCKWKNVKCNKLIPKEHRVILNFQVRIARTVQSRDDILKRFRNSIDFKSFYGGSWKGTDPVTVFFRKLPEASIGEDSNDSIQVTMELSAVRTKKPVKIAYDE
jgi:hypothetical protein